MEGYAGSAVDVHWRGPALHLPSVAVAPPARPSHREPAHLAWWTTRASPVAFQARDVARYGSWLAAQYLNHLSCLSQRRRCLRASVWSRARGRLGGASKLAASWVGRLMRWRPEEVAQTSEFRRRGWGKCRQNLDYPRAAPLEK